MGADHSHFRPLISLMAQRSISTVDAVHFHALPHGLCAVWVALEDVSAGGPLVYFPGSHRLPYLAARDLGLSHADVKAKRAPPSVV